MEQLQKVLPDLAEEIVSRAPRDPALKEALRDYEKVCAWLNDDGTSPEERAEWTAIHDELVEELRRLVLRLMQQQDRSEP